MDKNSLIINLEDISQPKCFHVLDTLRAECDIPVWHDDQQGTAAVTVAGGKDYAFHFTASSGATEVRFEGIVYGLVRMLAVPLASGTLREIRVSVARPQRGSMCSLKPILGTC